MREVQELGIGFCHNKGTRERTFSSRTSEGVGWSHPGINDEGILSPSSMRICLFFFLTPDSATKEVIMLILSPLPTSSSGPQQKHQ